MGTRGEVSGQLFKYLNEVANDHHIERTEIDAAVRNLLNRIENPSRIAVNVNGRDYARTLYFRRTGFAGMVGARKFGYGPSGSSQNMLTLAAYGKERMGFGGVGGLSKGTLVVGVYDHPDEFRPAIDAQFARENGVAVVKHKPAKDRRNEPSWVFYRP